MEASRNKIAQRQGVPLSIMQVNKLIYDPEVVMRKRSKLNLPEPQMPDHEVEEIAKIGVASDHILGESGGT